MKKSFLRALYVTMSGIGVFALLFRLQRWRQKVVTFHHVVEDALFDPSLPHLGTTCTRTQFLLQLDVIRSHFEVTTAIGTPGSCLITFDDGYRNNIQIAAPILNQYGVKGLFFIPACYWETSTTLLWIDELLMWVSHVPPGDYSVRGTTFRIDDSSRHRVWSHIYQMVLSDYSSRTNLRAELNELHPFESISATVDQALYQSRFEPLCPFEIEEMKAMGHLIGCHSFKHDILSKLSASELEEDFKKCDRYASQYNTTAYAYPFGGPVEVSPDVIRACQKSKYPLGFLNYTPRNENASMIGRISLANADERLFVEAKLCGFEQALRGFFAPMLRTASAR